MELSLFIGTKPPDVFHNYNMRGGAFFSVNRHCALWNT